tara:strand:- start:915 stop:1043 length:129 start_codon:yes stop_codon:yes gene_type:complete
VATAICFDIRLYLEFPDIVDVFFKFVPIKENRGAVRENLLWG